MGELILSDFDFVIGAPFWIDDILTWFLFELGRRENFWFLIVKLENRVSTWDYLSEEVLSCCESISYKNVRSNEEIIKEQLGHFWSNNFFLNHWKFLGFSLDSFRTFAKAIIAILGVMGGTFFWGLRAKRSPYTEHP